MTAMGNCFGIQGLGAEAIHSIRDDGDVRISEVSRPTEVAELDPRRIGDLAPGQYSDRRRHWESPIPKLPFGVGAKRPQNNQVQHSEIGSTAQSHSQTEALPNHSEDRKSEFGACHT